MRWIGYVRVSTAEQAASGLGLAAQEASVRAAVRQTGEQLVDLIVDDGYSAKDTHRPGFQRALAAIAAGDADGLVVAKLDRMSRSVADFARLLEWLVEAGAALKVLDLGIDTTTPGGEMVAHVMMAIAQWERRVIGQRTHEALDERKRQGRPVSGPSTPPDVVERIKAARAGGATYQAIADELNADAVPTARGGTMWRVSSVQTAEGYRQPRRPKPFKAPKVTRARQARRAS